MKTKMTWRLGKLPSPDEVRELVKDKIITNEEARDILFREENERDTKSLEMEIKFLRELVEKLSTSRSTTIETIKYIEKPYYHQGWYPPYATWCGGGAAGSAVSGSYTLANSAVATTSGTAFSSINTF